MKLMIKTDEVTEKGIKIDTEKLSEIQKSLVSVGNSLSEIIHNKKPSESLGSKALDRVTKDRENIFLAYHVVDYLAEIKFKS